MDREVTEGIFGKPSYKKEANNWESCMDEADKKNILEKDLLDLYVDEIEENKNKNEKSTYNPEEDYRYVMKAQKGDTAAVNHIIDKYRPMVYLKSKTYYMKGSDKEDIVQEGMIGLYKAIKDYKKDSKSDFYYFASMCITRQMITAVKTSTRKKHMPLNSYISLNKPAFDGEENSDRTLFEVINQSEEVNPENLVISKENYKILAEKISEVLTPLEEDVFKMYIAGKKYSDIAKKLDKNEKAVDNAMQRAKRKLEKALKEMNSKE
ncbi:RNA polymerase, sigma 30 subunit, SigH [Peptostreptococcus russellii]|uniref:RNA polymerase, sigma 30 subunit, SigH n=1 Tax=Peptostreptococcus russellii TaxID=215200 RepID=A0A1H8JBZ1_9FIRM|nr:RNA polymerase sporulation sigma factor SigH [Peptostreptococcus russellii]SEN77925.1 RNA polymerase, sigma 30 subunit, SigH [Peptostreptococcus russellii]